MIGILGKKVGMTQFFKEDGSVIPATVIEAGPCAILQVKKNETDGYTAIQLGFDPKKEKRTTKPLKGHFKKAKAKPVRYIKELRTDASAEYKLGQTVTVEIFQEKDMVDITGTTIGKGFQGGMKRWGWAGGKKSHGSMHHRQVGSVSASSYPSRIFKGHHMPGRMGGKRKTVQNLEIIKIDKENNLLAVKGSVPGHDNSFLIIRGARKHPIVRTKDDTAKTKDQKPKEKGQPAKKSK